MICGANQRLLILLRMKIWWISEKLWTIQFKMNLNRTLLFPAVFVSFWNVQCVWMQCTLRYIRFGHELFSSSLCEVVNYADWWCLLNFCVDIVVGFYDCGGLAFSERRMSCVKCFFLESFINFLCILVFLSFVHFERDLFKLRVIAFSLMVFLFVYAVFKWTHTVLWLQASGA